MKKTLAMLLTLVMLLSLCACSSNDSQTTDPSNSSQATTEGTQNPTDGTEGTTGTTQAPTDEPTTAPTDEPTTAPTDEPTTPPTQAPTEAPTTPPTQAPTEAPTTPPTTCSHNWKAATCTAPKTCSKCGATEGNAAGHSWKDATCTAAKTCTKCGATEGSASGHSWKDATCTAPKTCSKCSATEGSAAGHSYSNGTCSVCGAADPNVPFSNNIWIAYVLTPNADENAGDCLEVFEYSKYGFYHGWFWSNADAIDFATNQITYNGKTYYGDESSWSVIEASHTDNGNSVDVRMGWYDNNFEITDVYGKFTLTRTSETKFTVTESSADNDVDKIPVGIIFEVSANTVT